MDELLEELEYEIKILTLSGFYNNTEIKEIIEEQFIGENLNKYNIKELINKNKTNNIGEDFKKLEEAFNTLTKKQIVSIHNAGYEFEEGVNDAFEIYTHLFNKNHKPKGFVFYTLTDVEYTIETNELYLSFGDYEKNEELASQIAYNIKNVLEDNNFTVLWNGSLDEQICIKPFYWIKKYDDKSYEMEGAVENYLKINNNLII